MKFQEPYCRLLINNKADVNTFPTWNSWRGRNCLHWACLAPYEDESSESIKNISMVWEKETPCVSVRSVDYLRFLISSGIDVDARDFDGKTALCFAAERGWLEGVRALIETPMPSKVSLRSRKVALIKQAGLRKGIVDVVAQEIVDFLVRVSADPTIDSNKPFKLTYLNPCLYFSKSKHAYHVEDESDEEEEEKKPDVKVKIKSMITVEKENLEHSPIDHVNSNSGKMVHELHDEPVVKEKLEGIVNCSQEINNHQALDSSSHSSSSSSVRQEFITRKFNRNWDETSEDGTPLGIARAHNHINIIEYLTRIIP